MGLGAALGGLTLAAGALKLGLMLLGAAGALDEPDELDELEEAKELAAAAVPTALPLVLLALCGRSSLLKRKTDTTSVRRRA